MDRAARALLKQIVSHHKLKYPAEVFIEPKLFDPKGLGSTLRSQGLEVFGDPILRSQAVLVRREGSEEKAGIEVLRRRLLGVITARHYVMLDYDVPNELVDRACDITPGLESPTVSPLQNRDWSAVRAMVPRAVTNTVMDELYELGARAILVTDISACRL